MDVLSLYYTILVKNGKYYLSWYKKSILFQIKKIFKNFKERY